MNEAALGREPMCRCGEITLEAIQCPEHFHLFKGGQRLRSVGAILRASFPMDPSIPPEKLENARERGAQVDRLFAAYVQGRLDRIPAGTREDARDLLLKLIKWFDAQHFMDAVAQIVLGDHDHGGVLDCCFDGIPYELKATYNVDHTHRLQAAAYSRLFAASGEVGGARILHVTARLAKPVIVDLDNSDYQDWDTVLEHYRLQQRRKSAALELGYETM